MIYDQKRIQFGVCAHNPTHGICKGYKEHLLEEHIRLAKEMGSTLYRTDVSAADNPEWLEKLVDLAEANGIDLMLIVYKPGFAKEVAEKFKGRIKYYQILNEIDCWTFKKIPDQPDNSGKEISHFIEEKLAGAAETCKQLSAEIREADPDAKICINGTWTHYGMIQYMMDNGVDFDIVGWDWYSHMENYGLENCIKDLLELSDKDIVFCELNIFTKLHSEHYRPEYLTKCMDTIYNYPTDRIKGVCFYELLDEHGHHNPIEAEFGLVFTDDDANIVEPKPAYKAVQKLLVGE